ncbi:MAG: hypothetical protein KF684_04105 [Phycisphaeraceae bacterium]|nr:hypothetical protein [Phycisphaeraceae bacterium]
MSVPVPTVAAALGPVPAGAPLAPLSALLLRLDLTGSLEQARRDELLAVLMGVTTAFEEATGRCLVRRPAASVNLSREALTTLPLIEVPFAQPIESVAALWHDSEAHDDFGVAFDGAALVDDADYRVYSSLGTQAILLTRERSALVLASLRRGVTTPLRIEIACGFEPVSDADAWTPTNGATPVPADLVEACLSQAALIWRRRQQPHLRSEGKPVGQGVATQTFASARLAPSVRETLQRYATWEHALNLQTAADLGGMPE